MGLRLTKKLEYALSGLYYLAFIETGQYVQVRNIAETLDIPKRFLEQIFLVLREHKLLESKRGSRGGYKLAQPTSKIHLAQLYDILESGEQPMPSEPSASGASYYVQSAQQTIRHALASVTLDDLLDRKLQDYLEKRRSRQTMYYI